MTKRLFIAINLPQNVKEALGNFKCNLKKYKNIRWLVVENLHLTLYFLGEIDENDVDSILKCCRNSAKFFKSISVRMKEASLGPRPLNPRLIWITMEAERELEKLWQTLGDNLNETGIFYEDKGRKFLPHITIARLDKPIYDFRSRKIDLEYSFDSFELMQSELKTHGAEYKVLEKFKLGR